MTHESIPEGGGIPMTGEGSGSWRNSIYRTLEVFAVNGGTLSVAYGRRERRVHQGGPHSVGFPPEP